MISCTIGDLNFCVGHDRRVLFAVVDRGLKSLDFYFASFLSCEQIGSIPMAQSPEKEVSRQERHQEYENSGAGLPIYINGHVGGH